MVQPAIAIGRDYKTVEAEVAQTLTRSDVPGMVAQPYCIGNGQVQELALLDKARTLNCMHDAQAAIIPTDGGFPYIVRRLMPLECCRLQGYPDGHAQNLDTPEPTEEEIDWWCEVFETHRKAVKPDTKPKSRNQVRKWLQHPSNDSAECKMWGNSLAIPNAYHVLAGIAEEIRAEREGQPESAARPQRCKKCGRLLTREDSIKQGMGHRCAEKAYQQENTQMTIWDFIGKEG